MARRIVWSPEALEDIESIASYIERDSSWYAKAVVSRILAAVESLPDNREIGRIVPEWDKPHIRERFVYSYRIIYRIEPDRILVIAVIHGARLLQAFTPRIDR